MDNRDSPSSASIPNRLVGSDPGPSTRLIRRFSDRIEAQSSTDIVSKGLISKVERDRDREAKRETLQREWVLLLADADHLAQLAVSDEEKKMLESSRLLAQAWTRFQKALPASQQENLRERPPSLSLLYNTVANAQATWRQKRDSTNLGRVKGAFAKLNQFGEDHSQLLRMLPSNDKYICLITGAISSIVQASVNHENIAEALSDTLSELCSDIAHWKQQVQAHPHVVELRSYIRELYVLIFEFLADIFTTWSSSSLKRLALSFNKNAVQKLFQSKRDKIDRLTVKLDRAARLDSERKIDNLGNSLGLLDQVVTKADLQQFKVQVGSDLQRLLEAYGPRYANDPSIEPPPPSLQIAAAQVPPLPATEESRGSNEERLVPVYRADILATIPEVILHRQQQDIERSIQSSAHLQVDRQVLAKLREWIKEDSKTPFWIRGPAHVPKPSQNTLTAISLSAMATKAGVSTLWHFVTSDSSPMSPRPNVALRRLIQALLAQVFMQLPEKSWHGLEVPSGAIQRCFEDVFDIRKCLAVFQKLMERIPRPVLVIIDGAEALEDRSDQGHSRDLSDVLDVVCHPNRSEDAEHAEFKLCITTDGYIDAVSVLVQRGLFACVAYDLEADERGADDTLDIYHTDIFEQD